MTDEIRVVDVTRLSEDVLRTVPWLNATPLLYPIDEQDEDGISRGSEIVHHLNKKYNLVQDQNGDFGFLGNWNPPPPAHQAPRQRQSTAPEQDEEKDETSEEEQQQPTRLKAVDRDAPGGDSETCSISISSPSPLKGFATICNEDDKECPFEDTANESVYLEDDRERFNDMPKPDIGT